MKLKIEKLKAAKQKLLGLYINPHTILRTFNNFDIVVLWSMINPDAFKMYKTFWTYLPAAVCNSKSVCGLTKLSFLFFRQQCLLPSYGVILVLVRFLCVNQISADFKLSLC